LALPLIHYCNLQRRSWTHSSFLTTGNFTWWQSL